MTLDLRLQGLNGWYQVLDEAKGRSESMLVPTSISKSEASLSKYETTALRQKKTFAVSELAQQVKLIAGWIGLQIELSPLTIEHVTSQIQSILAI